MVEDIQRADDGNDGDEHDRRRQEGDDNVPCTLPASRSVDFGGFHDVTRQVLQGGNEDDDVEDSEENEEDDS